MDDPNGREYPLTVEGARQRVIDHAKYISEPHIAGHYYRWLCLQGAVGWLEYMESQHEEVVR